MYGSMQCPTSSGWQQLSSKNVIKFTAYIVTLVKKKNKNKNVYCDPLAIWWYNRSREKVAMSVVLLCRVCSTSTPWPWCTWTLSQRISSSPSLTATVLGPPSPALQKSPRGSKDHSFSTRLVGVMITLIQ